MPEHNLMTLGIAVFLCIFLHFFTKYHIILHAFETGFSK